REPAGGQHRSGVDAAIKRGLPRWTRRDGCRVRRGETALHRPQLMGQELGHGRLLHDALPVSAAKEPLQRLLDHPPSGVAGPMTTAEVPSRHAEWAEPRSTSEAGAPPTTSPSEAIKAMGGLVAVVVGIAAVAVIAVIAITKNTETA